MRADTLATIDGRPAQVRWGVAIVFAAGLLVATSLSATPLMPDLSEPAAAIQPEAALPAPADPAAPNPDGQPPADTRGSSAVEEDKEVVVRARRGTNPADPLELLNAKAFAVTQAVDDAVVSPAANKYEKAVPAPIRNGLRNALANLQEPIVILNYFLQHNVAKTGETIGRFVINSTIGIGGLFDMARRKPFHLPFRRNGFADTFGFYGVKAGPYLFLPLIGATTVRDLIGDNLDRIVLPAILGRPFNRSYFAIPAGIERTLDHRIAFDEELQDERKQQDPYAARRDFYLRQRSAEIAGLHEKSHRRVRTPIDAPSSLTPFPIN